MPQISDLSAGQLHVLSAADKRSAAYLCDNNFVSADVAAILFTNVLNSQNHSSPTLGNVSGAVKCVSRTQASDAHTEHKKSINTV